MCLGTKLSERSLQRYKAKGKKCGYIRVWKVVFDTTNRFRPQFDYYKPSELYNKGYVDARPDATEEDELIHAFRDEKSAKNWSCALATIICLVAPRWVKALGIDKTSRGDVKTLTTKAIVMPEYPKHRVTVREFRAAIKGKKVKKYAWEE